MLPSIRRLLTCTVVLASLPVLAPVAPAAQRCVDPAAQVTVEEQRLDRPVPGEVLRRSGFDAIEPGFRQRLCGVTDLDQAKALVRAEGRALWERAVTRAREHVTSGGLPANDDRPLYWARLTLTRTLRQWTPSFPLGDSERAALLWSLERESRGQTSVDFSRSHGLKHVLVSGFDPFGLDQDTRQSNPSGAAALALDGRVVSTPTGPARIETVLFPVLWKPFEQGMVERAFLPHLEPGAAQVDAFTTISQGRPGQFDVEHWNGRWHQGVDNNNQTRQGVIEIPDDLPTVDPPPEFVPTTQPYADIVRADTGRFPVFHNPQVVEIPAGQTEPVVRPDGPTPGSTARAGGGGSYLSNEIAYRTTLLRDAVGAELRGGHVHTPILGFAPGNDTEITDPVFEANLRDIVNQARAIVRIAAGARGDAPTSDVPRSPRDASGLVPKPSN